MGWVHPYAWGTGTVTAARIHFTMGAPNVGKTVLLRFMATATTPGDSLSMEVSVAATVALNGGVGVHETVDIPCTLPYTRGQAVSVIVQREPTDAADNAVGIVHLLGVDLIYASAGPVNTGGTGPYTPGAPPYSQIGSGAV
jgi:hypothetical protein